MPRGTYDLVVDYTGTRWSGATYSYDSGYGSSGVGETLSLEVGQGQVFPSNFFLALLLLFVPLFFIVRKHWRFESARRAESDFAPTGGSDDEDDDE